MHNTWVVITSINGPHDRYQEYTELGWNLVVVGDRKTKDSDWTGFNSSEKYYLSLDKQNELYPELSLAIGENTYARKNLGYLFAFSRGAQRIWDTDDDTFLRGKGHTLSEILLECSVYLAPNRKFINPYNFYAPDINIWPRGLPLQHVLNEIPTFNQVEKAKKFDILQTLVNREPDVDAIYRLTRGDEILDFPESPHILQIQKESWVPGNTQSTMWINSNLFQYLYIPRTVSFRFTDILKFYVAQIESQVAYAGFLSEQYRNEHDYFTDFKSEIQCYLESEKVIDLFINELPNNIQEAYSALISHGVCAWNELEILNLFLDEISKIRVELNAK